MVQKLSGGKDWLGKLWKKLAQYQHVSQYEHTWIKHEMIVSGTWKKLINFCTKKNMYKVDTKRTRKIM